MLLSVLVVGMVVNLSATAPEEEIEIPEWVEEMNAELDSLAVNLARSLAQSELRMFLLEQFRESEYAEKKLDFKSFLEGAVELFPGTRELLERVRLIESKMKEKEMHFSYLDLYFPVGNHLIKWEGGPEILIAWTPVSLPVPDEEEVREIISYTIEGEKVSLDPLEPPEVPTLVIAPGEPRAYFYLIEEMPEPPEEPEEGSERNSGSYIGIPWVRLLDDKEPWHKGAAEIYVLVVQVADGFAIKHEIHLPYVDYQRCDYYWNGWKWKHSSGSYWLGDPEFDDKNPLYFYWDGTYNKFTYFHFMEEDGGYGIKAISVTIGGITVKFYVHDEDDSLGGRSINRDAIPWVGYVRESTGAMEFDVDKDP
jgi:hypothetical protein